MSFDNENQDMIEDWEKKTLNILADEKNIKSSSKITGAERVDLSMQLFFGEMLKDDAVVRGVNHHLKLNKSIEGFFPKLMGGIFRGKVEHQTPPSKIERVMQ